jgi:hypothetical protein
MNVKALKSNGRYKQGIQLYHQLVANLWDYVTNISDFVRLSNPSTKI